MYFCELPTTLRAAFDGQPAVSRKRIQINLRKFGYEEAIDSLYERGTAEASMIFNLKCPNFDLTKTENAEALIKTVQRSIAFDVNQADTSHDATGEQKSTF